jgi:hypothetical protein
MKEGGGHGPPWPQSHGEPPLVVPTAKDIYQVKEQRDSSEE